MRSCSSRFSPRWSSSSRRTSSVGAVSRLPPWLGCSFSVADRRHTRPTLRLPHIQVRFRRPARPRMRQRAAECAGAAEAHPASKGTGAIRRSWARSSELVQLRTRGAAQSHLHPLGRGNRRRPKCGQPRIGQRRQGRHGDWWLEWLRSDADPRAIPGLRRSWRDPLLHSRRSRRRPGWRRGSSSEITNWVTSNFTATSVGGQTVYDLTAPTAGG